MEYAERVATKRARIVLIWLGLVLTIALTVLLVALMFVLPGIEPRTYPRVGGVQPLSVLYGPGVGKKPFFVGPMAAAIGSGGRVYVADTGNNRVVVFNRRGRYLFQFGGLGVAKPAAGVRATWKPGLLNYPTDIDCDGDGNVYVADFRNDQVQVFDKNGAFLRVFPERNVRVGRGASGKDGLGVAVTSLVVSGETVYMTDRYQVVEFTTQGKFVRQFGRPGGKKSDLDHPNGITLNVKSTLIVSDSNHNRILAFTPEGHFLWGTSQDVGIEIPRGVAAVGDGTLLVADPIRSRLLRISESGRLLDQIGVRGSSPGEFNLPTDVDVRGSRIVVAEKGNNRVQMIELQ